MDYNKIILKCRVCLDEFDEDTMIDLFKQREGEELMLNEKVEYCCGVRIRNSPEMPSKICLKCLDITRIWFNFRQICLNSQVYLESICDDQENEIKSEDNISGYLEYLLEDLQSFRTEACKKNSNLKVNENLVAILNSESETENYIIEEELMSDPEIENLFQSVDKGNASSEATQDDEFIDNFINDDTTLFETVQTNVKKTKRRRTVQQRDARKKNMDAAKMPKKCQSGSYMCSICGNVYTKKSSFTYHMSLHSNVKPHECELCGKTFRQVCELKNHMRRHTGEKPYKCSFCDRHFIDRSEKHRHERVHTNTRPYICTVCGKSFMYSAILKNHSKLHSGEKDYNCLVCKKAFTLQHQLKAHLQTLIHKQKEAQYVSAGYEVVYE